MIYWGLFALITASLIMLIVYVSLTIEDQFTEDYFGPALVVALILISICVPSSAYYTLGYFDMSPQGSKTTVENVGDDGALAELESKATSLRDALESPEDLTVKELQKALGDALALSDSVQRKALDQQSLVRTLRAEVELERSKTKESMRLAREVQALTKTQLDAVSFLIMQDARVEARRSFIYGILFSLPAGILASVMGAYVFRRVAKH